MPRASRRARSTLDVRCSFHWLERPTSNIQRPTSNSSEAPCMLHAIIMAGGAGTRFWPESRQLRPKQLVPPERTLVVTSAALANDVAEQLPELPRESIVGEPCKRDTAPCIGLAAML